MIKLGDHVIDELLYGVATDFQETEIQYTLSQLSAANIEITSEPREITDKSGNIIRRIYRSKNGEFSATNAMLHPSIMNAASGSTIEQATTAAPINMPKVVVVQAGGTITDETMDDDSIKVIGIFGNGANSKPLAKDTVPDYSDDSPEFGYDSTTKTITVPAQADGAPVSYLVMYTRAVTSGIKLVNRADKFPDAVTLTLYCSYVDPCEEKLRPAYLVLPNFMPDPSMTLSLDSENQELDFNGTLQVDYCSGAKVLYYIYYPDENIVVTGVTE